MCCKYCVLELTYILYEEYKLKKLVIIGAGETAKIAYDYFTSDSDYEVIGFAVENEFYEINKYIGLPVYTIEEFTNKFSKYKVDVFVAVSFIQNNEVRQRLVSYFINLGYNCASYISSKAVIHPSVKIGYNVFIFEGAVIQIGAIVNNNTIIWNGVQICHKSIVGDNCWLAPGCVIAGLVEIGNNCFIGANATVIDSIKVPNKTRLGAGTVLVKNIIGNNKTYVGCPARELCK